MKFKVVVSSLLLLLCSIIDQTIAGERELQGCADDGNFQFDHENTKGEKFRYKRGCDFAARKPKRRCEKKIDGGQHVRDVCRSTCDNCMIYDHNDFVLEGDRMYIGCDAYVFHMKIACGIFGNDPGLCSLKSTIVGIASINGTESIGGTPLNPFPTYGKNIDDLPPDAVCIGSGVFSRGRIKEGKFLPTPMITSDGCADQKVPDYMFVVKGELTTDGSNDIQLDFSRNYGSSYYTGEFEGSGIYRAFFSNYTASSSPSLPSEAPEGSSSESSSSSFYPSSAPAGVNYTLGPEDGKGRRLSAIPGCYNAGASGLGSLYHLIHSNRGCNYIPDSPEPQVSMDECNRLCEGHSECSKFATYAMSSGQVYCRLCSSPMQTWSHGGYDVYEPSSGSPNHPYSLVDTDYQVCYSHTNQRTTENNLDGCFRECDRISECTNFAAYKMSNGRFYCRPCSNPFRMYTGSYDFSGYNTFNIQLQSPIQTLTKVHTGEVCMSRSSADAADLVECIRECGIDPDCTHFSAWNQGSGFFCNICDSPLELNSRFYLKQYYDVYSLSDDNDSLICGQNIENNYVNNFLNPPADIQKIITFALGVTWGVGAIGGDGDPEGDDFSEECGSLQGVMGDESAVWLNIDSPEMMDLLALGDEADTEIDNRCNRGGCQNSATQRRASIPSGVEKKAQDNAQSGASPIPLCVAARPCSRTNPQGSFGEGISMGIFFGGLEVTINQAPEVTFVFNGIAASTFGDLEPLTLNAALFEDYVPFSGAHLYVEMQLKAPFGTGRSNGNINLGELDMTMKGTVYGMLHGNPDAGYLITQLLNGSGGGLSLDGLIDVLGSNFRLQFAVNVDVTATFSLDAITGGFIDSEFPFELGSASAMVDFYSGSSQAFLDLRLSTETDIAEAIRTGLEAALEEMSLGDFGDELTNKIFGALPSARAHARFMLRIYSTGRIDFGWDIGFTLPFNPCGPIYPILDAAFEAADVFIDTMERVGQGRLVSGFRNTVRQADNLIERICTAPFITFKVKFEDGRFDLSKTCFGVDDHELCLDMLPTCPGDGRTPDGNACSANSDCRSGYCLNHPTYKTSIACTGTCMRKLHINDDCSPGRMNILVPDLTNPEHNACHHNNCICGRCVRSRTGSVPNTADCSANSDCRSGYCMGYWAIGCAGTCVNKAPDDGDCSPSVAQDIGASFPTTAAHEFCRSGRCYCNTCALSSSQRLRNGHSCSADSDCNSRKCQSRVCPWLWAPNECYWTPFISACLGECRP